MTTVEKFPFDRTKSSSTISFKVTSTIAGVTPTEHMEEGSSNVAEEAPINEHGKGVYNQSCAVCHNNGMAGAPITGDKEIWADRITPGMEAVIKRAINGYVGEDGAMPAKGGNMSLSDEDVAAAVHYMIEQSQ